MESYIFVKELFGNKTHLILVHNNETMRTIIPKIANKYFETHKDYQFNIIVSFAPGGETIKHRCITCDDYDEQINLFNINKLCWSFGIIQCQDTPKWKDNWKRRRNIILWRKSIKEMHRHPLTDEDIAIEPDF